MSKQLPLGSLPRDAQNVLEDLLQKERHALSPAELGFLRGRRDYLTADQRKFYGTDEEVETPPPAGGEGSEPEALFDRAVAKERLKELGVEFNGNAKNEDLKALLEKAEAEADEEVEDEDLTLDEVKAELDALDLDYDEDADEEELRELLAGAK